MRDYRVARHGLQIQIKLVWRNRVQMQLLRFHSEAPRPLGSKSVNVHLLTVGRPGLDPGTLCSYGFVKSK